MHILTDLASVFLALIAFALLMVYATIGVALYHVILARSVRRCKECTRDRTHHPEFKTNGRVSTWEESCKQDHPWNAKAFSVFWGITVPVLLASMLLYKIIATAAIGPRVAGKSLAGVIDSTQRTERADHAAIARMEQAGVLDAPIQTEVEVMDS